MFIQTEDTPNPASLKFLPGRAVLDETTKGPIDIDSAEKSEVSPLASSLFNLKGVAGVLLGYDFLTVTKAEDQNWAVLRPQVLATIMNHYVANKPVLNVVASGCSCGCGCSCAGSDEDEDDDTTDTEDTEVVRQIRELIELRVRPALAQDGGDVEFCHFADGIVYLRLKGACAGCPSSTITLKHGIETLLKHHIPAVESVAQVR